MDGLSSYQQATLLNLLSERVLRDYTPDTLISEDIVQGVKHE